MSKVRAFKIHTPRDRECAYYLASVDAADIAGPEYAQLGLHIGVGEAGARNVNSHRDPGACSGAGSDRGVVQCGSDAESDPAKECEAHAVAS